MSTFGEPLQARPPRGRSTQRPARALVEHGVGTLAGYGSALSDAAIRDKIQQLVL